MEQSASRSSNYLPTRPASRMTGTPNRRPSSSSGSSFSEPKSQYLQQALLERRGQATPQPRPTPPRRPSTRTGLSFQDEWTAAGDAPIKRSQSTDPQRHHKRRASVGGTNSRDTIPAPRPGLNLKETNELIDRLQKDNFDLKLRVTLQDDRLKKLVRDLEETKERVEAAEILEEKYSILEDKAAKLEQQVTELEKENAELMGWNEEAVKELEQRDMAVKEAVTIIHELEQKLEAKQISIPPRPRVQTIERHHDSDYFSAEPDSPYTPAVSAKLRPGSSSGSSILPADSDYYSATSYSSPASTAPKAIRRPKPMPIAMPDVPRPRSTVAAPLSRQEQAIADHIPTRISSAKALVKDSLARAQQTSSSIHSSPDHTPRPGLRRARRTQALEIASLRLQNQQQVQGGPSTPHISTASNLTPRQAPPSSLLQLRQSATAIPDIPRSSSEPPQDSRPAGELYHLWRTGRLNMDVTTDAHSPQDLRLRVPGEAPPNATPSLLEYPDDDDDQASQVTPVTARPTLNREHRRDRNSTGRIPDEVIREDGLSDEESAIPATITSGKDRRTRHSESEYSFASSVTANGTRRYPPWPPSGGIELRNFMFGSGNY
ncbi:hypothetical protein NA57DRAFT_69926 [Rhizodiscina lignyota]|uniref:Centrosomin N-terminal motif 1 domain-containing protein n=1 Tax=Rhizodiscina lignyota TaxID=1504668 RepID=A0A9P4ILG7_9PEZI|nr:hypothetical protein NA57DRAFT_69926 [Rhizodiscina lignyota]